MPRHPITGLLVLWLTIALPIPTTCAIENGQAHSRWAIVSSSKIKATGIPDLLTARLSELPDIELVERDDERTIIDEQELSNVLGASAAGRRIKLGERISADVLVIVRGGKTPQVSNKQPPPAASKANGAATAIQVVVCDCRSGARLINQIVEIEGKSADQCVDDIFGVIRTTQQSLTKDGLRYVVGVSPLVCKNLTHNHEFLQDSIADLIASHFVSQPGVAVLEHEEATAIFNELADQDDSEIHRTVPVLIDGDFRIDKVPNAASHISLRLNVTRSRALPKPLFDETFPLQELKTRVAQLLNPLATRLDPASDPGTGITPDAQSRWLTERAESFSRLGHWRQSLSLREAALLIDPRDVETRMQLLREHVVFQHEDILPGYARAYLTTKASGNGSAERLINIYFRMMDHQEYLIRNQLIDKRQAYEVIRMDLRCGVRESELKDNSGDRALLHEAEKQRKARLSDWAVPLFRLPDTPVDSTWRATNVIGQSGDLQAVYLNRLINRIDFQQPDLPDFEFLRDIWITKIPDRIGLSGVLGKLVALATPPAVAFGKRPRFRKEVYAEWRIAPEQCARFLEEMTHCNHQSARLAASFEWLNVRWRLIDQNSSPDDLKAIDDLAESALIELENYSSISMHGRTYFEGGTPNEGQINEIRWHLYRLAFSADAHGPPRKLKPSRRKTKQIRRKKPSVKAEPTAVVKTTRLKFRVPSQIGSAEMLWHKVDPEIQKSGHAKQKFQDLDQLQNWLACGDELDIFWNPFQLNYWTKPGKPSLFRFPTDRVIVVDDVRWDGKYVWVATLANGIWLLDSKMNVVTQIDKTAGLPPSDHSVRVLPLRQQQACVVGSFGPSMRAWCAIVDATTDKPTVKVFHEAKETDAALNRRDRIEKSAADDIRQAFIPDDLRRWSILSPESGKFDDVIYVGRWQKPPLLITPKTMAVRPGDGILPRPPGQNHSGHQLYRLNQRKYYQHETRRLVTDLYRDHEDTSDFDTTLMKHGHWSADAKRSQHQLFQGYFTSAIPIDNRIFFFGLYRSCAMLDPVSGIVERVPFGGARFTELSHFSRSAHFGIVGWGRERGNFENQLFRLQVERNDSAERSRKANQTHPRDETARVRTPKQPEIAPSESELAQIKLEIQRRLDTGHNVPKDARILFAGGVYTLDDWLPKIECDQVHLDPPYKKKGARVFAYRGRIVRVDSFDESREDCRVWMNADGAPQMVQWRAFDHTRRKRVLRSVYWATYNDRGTLARVIRFDDDLKLSSIDIFDCSDDYQFVKKIDYPGRGNTQYEWKEFPLDAEGNLIHPGDESPVGYSHRFESIMDPTRIGLAPYYPIPKKKRKQ